MQHPQRWPSGRRFICWVSEFGWYTTLPGNAAGKAYKGMSCIQAGRVAASYLLQLS